MTPPIILSFTSTPRRNGRLEPTLASIAAQQRRPDEVHAYLPTTCAPLPVVPGLTIIRHDVIDDRGPIMKISAVVDPMIPADALVVTIDDDILYEPTWLATLIAAAEAMPDAVVGRSGWDASSFCSDPIHGFYVWATGDRCDVVEGWSGVVYRKAFFDATILDPPPPFRFVDDVWISGQLHRRQIPRRLVRPTLARERPDNDRGLHNRPDFVALNRRATILAFT